MKHAIWAIIFTFPLIAMADALPRTDDLFTRAKVEDYKKVVSPKTGEEVPGKFIVTFDKKIRCDDGVLWAVLKKKTVRYGFSRYLFTGAPKLEGCVQGDPTDQVLVQIDPKAPAFKLEDLKGSEVLIFTVNYDPLPRP